MPKTWTKTATTGRWHIANNDRLNDVEGILIAYESEVPSGWGVMKGCLEDLG